MYTWYHMASSSWNHETSIPNDSREDLSRSRAHRAHLLQLVFQHLNLLLACVGSMLRQVLLPAWNSLVSFCDISPMQDSLILRVSKESFRFSCWRSTCSRSAIFSDTNSATFQLQPATLLGPSLTRWKWHLLFTWLLTVFHCFPLFPFSKDLRNLLSWLVFWAPAWSFEISQVRASSAMVAPEPSSACAARMACATSHCKHKSLNAPKS